MSSRLYLRITELPLTSYITALVDEDLTALVKQGTATDEELQTLFDDIQQQYNDAIGGREQNTSLSLVKEIKLLETDYNLVVLLVAQLRTCYVKRFADELNKILGTSFQFDITRLEAYDKLLDRCETRARNIKLQAELKNMQLQSTQPTKEGQAPTREYFTEVLVSIGNYIQAQLNPEVMSTYDFCYRVRSVSNQMDKQRQ